MAELVKSRALHNFTRLSNQAYLYDPNQPPTPGHPHLIIVSAWMNADAKHIGKYTDYYQLTFPHTPILLLTSATGSFFLSERRRKLDLAVLVGVVKTYTQPRDGADKLGVLVHAFSNGGGGNFAFLARAYYQDTGLPFPASALVYDSLPGVARLRQGMQAFSMGFPRAWYLRLPMQAMLFAMIILFYNLPELFGRKNLAQVMRDILNSTDPEYIRRSAPRTYIYSDGDALIPHTDIEAHVREAEARGFTVKTVFFDKTPHVAHMRTNPERYWSAVQETWKKRA